MKDEMSVLLDIYEIVERIWYFELVFIILFAIKTISSILTNYNKKRIQYYSRKSENYFKNSRFNELLDFCKSKEDVEGFNGYSLWWQGKAYIELSQFTKAKELFLRVAKEHPHWYSSSVKPYLKIIKKREKVNSLRD